MPGHPPPPGPGRAAARARPPRGPRPTGPRRPGRVPASPRPRSHLHPGAAWRPDWRRAVVHGRSLSLVFGRGETRQRERHDAEARTRGHDGRTREPFLPRAPAFLRVEAGGLTLSLSSCGTVGSNGLVQYCPSTQSFPSTFPRGRTNHEPTTPRPQGGSSRRSRRPFLDVSWRAVRVLL